ncbi:MAG: branched-chain amino acid ABC transporter permease [Candidatus Methanomethyliaceae archaeon]
MLPTGVIIHVLVFVCIYAILAVGLNLIMGCAALFTIANAALFGVGAYTSALLALAGYPFWVDILAAVFMAGLISFLIGWPTLNLVGDYLAVATMGLGEILVSVFRNWDSVTRGPMGLPGIPPAKVFGVVFDQPLKFLLLSAIFLLIVFLIAERLAYSPFGRVLKGIREDEIAVNTLGKNTFRFKMWAFVIGGAFMGGAGSLYSHYVGFIDPSSFTLWNAFFLWLIVILGGLGSNVGAVLASLAFVGIRESLRFLGLPGNVTAAIQQVLFGVILIAIMIYAPRGLIPERKYVTRYKGNVESRESQ